MSKYITTEHRTVIMRPRTTPNKATTPMISSYCRTSSMESTMDQFVLSMKTFVHSHDHTDRLVIDFDQAQLRNCVIKRHLCWHCHVIYTQRPRIWVRNFARRRLLIAACQLCWPLVNFTDVSTNDSHTVPPKGPMQRMQVQFVDSWSVCNLT